MSSDEALGRLMVEIRDRLLGLDAWERKQPEDSAYGLAIVPSIRGMDTPCFLIDDEEFRERARPLLPKERVTTTVGQGILVVVPLY